MILYTLLERTFVCLQEDQCLFSEMDPTLQQRGRMKKLFTFCGRVIVKGTIEQPYKFPHMLVICVDHIRSEVMVTLRYL